MNEVDFKQLVNMVNEKSDESVICVWLDNGGDGDGE